MMPEQHASIESEQARSAGPLQALSPGVVGGCAWLLTVGAVVASAAIGGTIPPPYASTTGVATYFSEHSDAALAAAMMTLGSAPLLMLFGALVAQQVHRLGSPRVAQILVPSAGTGCGVVVAVASGGLWILTRPEGTAVAAVTHVVADGVFVLGGPVFAQLVGLMCLGLASTLFARPGIVPQPMVNAGFALGGVGLGAALGLLWSPLLFLMPIARFGGLGWLVVTAAALDRKFADGLRVQGR